MSVMTWGRIKRVLARKKRETAASREQEQVRPENQDDIFQRPPASPDDLGDDATDRAERSEPTTHLSAAQPIFGSREIERAKRLR
jgi:hypothetical protein